MPTEVISPIQVSRTPGGFLEAARQLDTQKDWRGGVSFTSNCGGVGAWQCDYSGAQKDVDDLGDPVSFESFLLYVGVRCSGAPVEDVLREHAALKMTRGTSGALARELATGAATGNPSLQSEGVDDTPATDVCVDSAIAGLLSIAEDCGGGELTFHAPFVALASLMKYQLVVFEGGRYRIGGHTIIIDGYPNVGPDAAADPTATDEQAWIYATGPVEYAVGANTEYYQFTGQQNESVLIAERLAVVRFDPCCVHAIRANLC